MGAGPVLSTGNQAVNPTAVQATVTSNVTCCQMQSDLPPTPTAGAFRGRSLWLSATVLARLPAHSRAQNTRLNEPTDQWRPDWSEAFARDTVRSSANAVRSLGAGHAQQGEGS